MAFSLFSASWLCALRYKIRHSLWPASGNLKILQEMASKCCYITGRDADPSPPSSAVVKKEESYTSTPPKGRTACKEPQSFVILHYDQLVIWIVG
jgi:hypothetical protein